MGARARLALLVTSGVLVVLPALADQKWLRLESTSFVVVGATDERTLRNIAWHLEQFRETFATLMPTSRASVALPAVVVVFPSERAYKPFWPLYEGKPRPTSGLFLRSEDANYISLNAEYGEQVYKLVYHEYTHFITSKLFAAPPVWLEEGLAEYYSTLEASASGDRVDVGRVIEEHVRLLRTASPVPLEQLLATDHGSPLYNEWDRQGVFYAQSWALVHMLAIGSEARRGQLGRFIERFTSGTPRDEAFRQAFQCEPSQLQRELSGYVRQPSFRRMVVQLRQPVAMASLGRATAISTLEAESYLGDLLGRMGRADQGRARLQAVLKADPHLARANAALGLLHAREGRLADALPLLEQAVARDGNEAAFQYGLGKTIVRSLLEKGGTLDPKALERARTALSRATELRPDFADALAHLGLVLVLSGEADRGRALIDSARKLVPAREDYTLMLAEAYAMTGNLAVATSIARQLAASAQTTEARSAARLQLDRIAAAREAGATSEVSIPGAEAADQLNTLGLEAYNQGRYQEALEYLRRATEKDPQQPFAWNNLGLAYSRLDRHEDAIAAYRQQIAVSPDDEFAHRNLAAELWFAGQTADAERELTRHLAIKPQDLDATLDLGRLQWAAGEAREALATYERATRSPDVRSVALIEQAFLARSLGDSAKTIAAVDAALTRSPAPGDYADAALLLAEPPPDLVRAEEYARRAVADATIRLAHLSFDEGIRERQALGYALGTAWNALGLIALQRGDLAVAERHLQASWSLVGDPFAADMLGRICLSRGQRQRALEWFARAADGQGGQGAREQLEKLLPNLAKREALVTQVRGQVSSGVEVEVPASPGVTGSARVALLINASGRVEDSRVVEGDSALSAIAPGLTGIAVQSLTPGHEINRLVRIGRVTCEAGRAKCRLGLEPLLTAGSNHRFVR